LTFPPRLLFPLGVPFELLCTGVPGGISIQVSRACIGCWYFVSVRGRLAFAFKLSLAFLLAGFAVSACLSFLLCWYWRCRLAGFFFSMLVVWYWRFRIIGMGWCLKLSALFWWGRLMSHGHCLARPSPFPPHEAIESERYQAFCVAGWPRSRATRKLRPAELIIVLSGGCPILAYDVSGPWFFGTTPMRDRWPPEGRPRPKAEWAIPTTIKIRF